MDWVNKINKINNKFKFQLFGRNVDNLEKCYNNISLYDKDHTGCMSEHAFNLFLNSFGVFLSTQEIRTIKEGFCKNDKISYIEFLENVRHDISSKRVATIDHCFEELSENGVVCLKKLLSCFDAKNHPHSRCMVKEPEKIQC